MENKEKCSNFEEYKQTVILDDCDNLEKLNLSWYDYLFLVVFYSFACFKFGFVFERIDRGLLRYNVTQPTILSILFGWLGLEFLPWVTPFCICKATQKAIKKLDYNLNKKKLIKTRKWKKIF